MTVRRVSAGYGRAATEALRQEILRAKSGDPLAAVTVAVPSNYAGLSLRRLLAAGTLGDCTGAGRPGLVNVGFLSLGRVSELLGAPTLARAGRRPLTPAVRAEALRATLADRPGLFAAVATHHATERVLDRTFGELRAASPESLDALAAQSQRAAEVVRLFRETRVRLAADWYDDHDLAETAVDAVTAGAPALAEVGQLVVFCPRRRSTTAALDRLVDALGERAVVIEGTFGDELPTGTHILGAGDPDDEVRAAVRELMARARQGTPLHRMAILLGADVPYALLAHQQLDAAGIPHNGPAVRTLAQTVAGIAVLGLLDLPEHDWRRDDVIAWMASAPVLMGAGAEVHAVPATAWDVVSRSAGVVGGAAQWTERLDRFAASLDEEIARAESGDDVEDWRVRRWCQDRDRARELRAFVADLVAAVDVGERATWRDLAAWACGLLDRYLGGDLRHGRWPEDEQEAWRQVRAALERLGGLDVVATARARPDLTVFLRAVQRELEAPAGRIGKFGDGVFVGHVTAALGTDFDHVFVLGMAEGTMPGRPREDALLPDRERAGTGGELALRATRLEDQHHDFLTALAAAGGDRILLWPRSDLRAGRTRLPSRWLLDTATALAGRKVYSADLPTLEEMPHRIGALLPPESRGAAESNGPTESHRIVAVPSFEAGTRHAVEPASLHDFDLGSLARWQHAGGRPDRHFLAAERPDLGRGLDAALIRRTTAFTRFDGNLPAGSVPVPGPDKPMSATSLETYAACPFKYFLGKALELSSPAKPEEVMQLSPMDKGTLVHTVLERYVLERIDGGPPSLERLRELAEEECEALQDRGLTGKALFWDYDREVIDRELVRFHTEDDLEPVAAELAFGLEGKEAVQVTLPDGRRLSFKGKADRVDRRPDGTLVVTDYKTGSKSPFDKLDTGDPVKRGTKLQLPIYGLAARAIHGTSEAEVVSRYWFVSEKGDFAEVGYPLDAARLERFEGVLGVITDGIAAASFPARPGDEDGRPGFSYANCTFCDFDSLCSRERDRNWDRKHGAPELAAYVELAEGDYSPAAEAAEITR